MASICEITLDVSEESGLFCERKRENEIREKLGKNKSFTSFTYCFVSLKAVVIKHIQMLLSRSYTAVLSTPYSRTILP